MGSHKRFRSLSDQMELDIMDGAKEGLRGSKIHDLLELNYGDEAPKSRQTVYNYLKHMREQEQGKPESQDDDSVWSLGAMASAPKALCIEWDDIAVILRVRYTLRDEIARAEWGMPDRDLTMGCTSQSDLAEDGEATTACPLPGSNDIREHRTALPLSRNRGRHLVDGLPPQPGQWASVWGNPAN